MNGRVTATFSVEMGRLGRPQRGQSLTSPGRQLRVARLLALAHYIDEKIRAGEIADLAEAARRAGLTRARVTQVMNLLLLAPVIQEVILATPAATDGRDPVTERQLRQIVAEPVWARQVAIWNDIRGRTAA